MCVNGLSLAVLFSDDRSTVFVWIKVWHFGVRFKSRNILTKKQRWPPPPPYFVCVKRVLKTKKERTEIYIQGH